MSYDTLFLVYTKLRSVITFRGGFRVNISLRLGNLFVQFNYSVQFIPAFITNFLMLIGNWQSFYASFILKSLGFAQKKRKRKREKK